MRLPSYFLRKIRLAFILGSTTLTFFSCIPEKKPATEAFTFNNMEWNDSVKTDLSKAYCHIKIDYPATGHPELLRNIREWLSDQLGGTLCEKEIGQEDFIPQYGKMLLDSAQSDFRSLAESKLGTNYEWNITVKLADETDRYLTYIAEIYTYSGGAHGSYIQQGATFRKNDGRKFGWDMFKNAARTELPSLLKDAIHNQYFEPGTDKEFYGQLLDVDTASYRFPLPQTEPYIAQDGVHFIYQEYEIAAYAAGSPSCVLPFGQVKELLTHSACELIE